MSVELRAECTDEKGEMSLLSSIGQACKELGKYDEAEQMYREALGLYEKVLGREHPDTLTSMNNLALVLDSQGKYEEAEQMHRETLGLCEKVLGREHPSTLSSMNNLANVLDRQGKYEEAEQMRPVRLGGSAPTEIASATALSSPHSKGKRKSEEDSSPRVRRSQVWRNLRCW